MTKFNELHFLLFLRALKHYYDGPKYLLSTMFTIPSLWFNPQNHPFTHSFGSFPVHKQQTTVFFLFPLRLSVVVLDVLSVSFQLVFS